MGDQGKMKRTRPITVKTKDYEIYMRLPGLNYQKEIIFSKDVSYKAICKIIGNINKRCGEVLEILPIEDRYVIIKKGNVLNLNVYLKER